MSEEKHFVSALKWLAYAILLYLIVDTFSKSYPDFREYGIIIVAAFVIFAAYKIRKRAKLVSSLS